MVVPCRYDDDQVTGSIIHLRFLFQSISSLIGWSGMVH